MKKSVKKLLLYGLVTAMTLSASLTALAGTWKQDHIGWWWQENNGSYPVSTWQWIDGNNDGIAECYYFDNVGYCLLNTTTPDGYTVNADGAWIVNSTIQTKKAEVQAQTNHNNTSDGRQMYFNHPKWTKEEVLAIKTADDFKRRFYFEEYRPKDQVVITSQASADKYSQYLDKGYDYANYLSSAYSYGLEKEVYLYRDLPKFNNSNLQSVVKSTELYEASKDLFKWKSFDDFYIYKMIGAANGSPGKGSIYTTTDSAWKKYYDDAIDNIARWEGQEVPDIYLTHDRTNDSTLRWPELLYCTYEEVLDHFLNEGDIISMHMYDYYKQNEGEGYNWVEPTQFFQLQGGSSVPGYSTVNNWLEAMKPTIREKYGVEISWDAPYKDLMFGLKVWLTPVK